MADLIRMDLGQFLADVKKIKRNIWRIPGIKLKAQLEAEYKTLVEETPQYSGSTAASWSMGFLAPMVNSQKNKPKTVAEALRKGQDPAVGESLARINLSNHLTDYLQKDVTVTNGSPNFEHAEGGPLRAVNEPGGMFARFQNRIRNMRIDVDGEELLK